MRLLHTALAGTALLALAACAPATEMTTATPPPAAGPGTPTVTIRSDIDARLAKYTTVRLTADLSRLTENERRMLPYLIAAAREMDAVFWMQASGPRDQVLGGVTDPRYRR